MRVCVSILRLKEEVVEFSSINFLINSSRTISYECVMFPIMFVIVFFYMYFVRHFTLSLEDKGYSPLSTATNKTSFAMIMIISSTIVALQCSRHFNW